LAELVAVSHLKLVVFQAVRGDESEQETVSSPPLLPSAVFQSSSGAAVPSYCSAVFRGDPCEWRTSLGRLCQLLELPLYDFLSHVRWETFYPSSSHVKVTSSLNQSSCLNLLRGT